MALWQVGRACSVPAIQLFRVVYLTLLKFCLASGDAEDTTGFDF